MALTIAKFDPNPDFVSGNKKVRFRKITFDSSYPTGGEALAASDVGLGRIHSVHVCGPARKSDATDAVLVSYDRTNKKLVCYRQKDPANAGGADIALPEVGNTADLSSYSVDVEVIGV
jgi:hypothetical protein